MGNGRQIQCKSLKKRGKDRRRKNNGKPGEKQWETRNNERRSRDAALSEATETRTAPPYGSKNPPMSGGGRPLAKIRD
jgi:hypothetical protein